MVDMILASEGKIVVSAPSNAATANIALKLFRSSRYSVDDICIFGSNCNESVHFLNPVIRREKFILFQKQYDDRNDEEGRNQLIRRFAAWLHLDESEGDGDLIYNRVAALCLVDGDILLREAKAVFCTLNSAGSGYLRFAVGLERGTLFLDEAGQCTEAEFFIATTFPGIKRIVVVGDPMQLPATVIDQGCVKAGYGRSWLQNIHHMYPERIHLLDTQYRMDPQILEFPNQLFYNGRIKSGESVKSRQPLVSSPVGFVDTAKQGAIEEKERFSWRNTQEASTIRAVIRQDRDIQSLLEHRDAPRIVVITPYCAQADLLKTELQKVKVLASLDWAVSTVDSFQGQEADIVIISTVRSRRIGFVDDPNRINVALTRAKRVVRIVGNLSLFSQLGRSSTLRQLAVFVNGKNMKLTVTVKNIAFTFPDWRQRSRWTPTMNSRFHHCLKGMPLKEQALSLRTLQAVVSPTLQSLTARPNKNYWQISSLRGSAGTDCCIVWIAKQDTSIEAHFAGSRADCLRFIQTHAVCVPAASCKVKSDLSDIIHTDGTKKKEEDSVSTPTWLLSNCVQKAIEDDKIVELPQGYFRLDREQRAIVSSSPPLLLESRSGTGKTNVLFQHVIESCRSLKVHEKPMPLCFITVSKLLRTQLQKLYAEVKDIDNVALQSCIFLSLSDLLDELAARVGLDIFSTAEATSFNEYALSRKAHTKLPVNQSLIENEIGGVIVGSLQSAEMRRPLDWDEYKDDIRSNISRNEGALRRRVYDEFSSYQRWKKENNRMDLNDAVLEILARIDNDEDLQQIFSAVYLDEVQDFSYATIYLICSIGGRSNLNWVFAGDTAQSEYT